jgi:energy-coupling factor transport system permease protein
MSRAVHPGAWWAWSLALATAATRTTNPVLLGLLLTVAAYVVAERRTAHSGRAFGFFLRLGAFVLVLRLVFEIIFGSSLPGNVLVRLPSIPLPSALAGLRIGGPVTSQAVLTAAYGGLQLATLLICLGAANSLASPRRLLRALPGALYEVGVAVTVAMSFAPQLVQASTRVRRARRLRGKSASGLRGWIGVALPVLQDALERSIDLAAAMDSKGFGRRGAVSAARRKVTTGAVLVGLVSVAAAVYGLLDAGSPAIVGLPLLLAGSLIAGAAVLLGGRGVVRSKYRPDPWRAAEWLVVGAGAAAVVGALLGGRLEPGSLHTGTYPIVAPQLPWAAVIGILLGLLPAWLTPRPPADHPADHSAEAAHAADEVTAATRPPDFVGVLR